MAELLGLKDWVIRLNEDEPEDPDALASVRFTYGRKLVVLFLSDRFLEDNPEEQRNTIAHELIHCHFHLLDSYETRSTINRIRPAIEFGVDGLATAIDKFLPLPDVRP